VATHAKPRPSAISARRGKANVLVAGSHERLGSLEEKNEIGTEAPPMKQRYDKLLAWHSSYHGLER
jgi:hypothetical protein